MFCHVLLLLVNLVKGKNIFTRIFATILTNIATYWPKSPLHIFDIICLFFHRIILYPLASAGEKKNTPTLPQR